MKTLHHLEISSKLLAAFALVLCLSAVLGLSALSRMHAINQVTSELSSKWLPQASVILSARSDNPAADEQTRLKALNLQMSKLLVSAMQSSQEAAEQTGQLYQDAQLLTFGLLAGLLSGGTLLALWLARSISAPLQQAMLMAQRIADGDLGTRIPPQPRNQTGKLLQSMQHMNDSLRDIVAQVQSGARAIGGAAAEIAEGNQDLSGRTKPKPSPISTSVLRS